jgi:hypothetical protein
MFDTCKVSGPFPRSSELWHVAYTQLIHSKRSRQLEIWILCSRENMAPLSDPIISNPVKIDLIYDCIDITCCDFSVTGDLQEAKSKE